MKGDDRCDVERSVVEKRGGRFESERILEIEKGRWSKVSVSHAWLLASVVECNLDRLAAGRPTERSRWNGFQIPVDRRFRRHPRAERYRMDVEPL